jgi:uncharacterized membrane protein YqgA involved in biofilm formation
LLGTIVNSIAIILGAILGNLLQGKFGDNIKSTIMQGLSLTVMIIGISMALKTNNQLILTLSVVIGGILGEWWAIEDRLNQLGSRLEDRFARGDGDFTKAFVSASLIYCVGAMAITGSIESGLTGNHSILYIKSILDGVSAVVFASSLGLGVAFSGISVLIYQGLITIGAIFIKGFLTDAIITEMSAVGGLLILGIGINMLDTKLKQQLR